MRLPGHGDIHAAPAVERSTYVLFATAALGALVWYWQPIEGTVWKLEHPGAVNAVWFIFWLCWGVLLLATFLINHFELFGLRQVFARLTGHKIPEGEFCTPMLYKYVRHPIYLGFIMAFWAAPHMTYGHLLFAAAGTGYILVGIWFEQGWSCSSLSSTYERAAVRPPERTVAWLIESSAPARPYASYLRNGLGERQPPSLSGRGASGATILAWRPNPRAQADTRSKY